MTYAKVLIFCILANCNNCTGIKVNGISRNNNEILCKHPSDNITFQADVPLVASVDAFKLRLNDNSCPPNCDSHMDSLRYNCSNLTTGNRGVYCIHVTLNFELDHNPEWGSNNVTIIVQGKAQN